MHCATFATAANLPDMAEQAETVEMALRREMAERNLSQAQAARELGVHPTRLNRWLLDGMAPEPNAYETIMQFLQVDKATFACLLMESNIALARRRGRLGPDR